MTLSEISKAFSAIAKTLSHLRARRSGMALEVLADENTDVELSVCVPGF
jgi:hypothetical protein